MGNQGLLGGGEYVLWFVLSVNGVGTLGNVFSIIVTRHNTSLINWTLEIDMGINTKVNR